MPVGRTGRHMRSRKVMILVTSATSYRIQSLPIWSASYLHRMLMAIVSLPREVSTGMAIHAARMAQHRNNGLKSSRTSVTRYAFALRSGIKCQQERGYDV